MDLCISLINSIETLILLNERNNSLIYEYFGEIECPQCKSLKIETYASHDERNDEMYYLVKRSECDWTDWTQ